MDDKKELIKLLSQILSYFEVQAHYGGVEKDIFNYYKIVKGKCDKFDFKDIDIHNWSRAYLEANSDWDNPILETMNKADKLVEYFQSII